MVLLHLVLYDLPKIDFNTNPGAVYLWRPRQWQTLDHGRSLSSYRCIFFKTVLLLYLVSNFISLFFTLPWLSLNKILFLLIHTDGNSTSVLYSVDGEIQSKWDFSLYTGREFWSFLAGKKNSIKILISIRAEAKIVK